VRTNEIGRTMWVERNLEVMCHALGDQGVVFRGGLWSALQPTNLALEGAHSTLEFYHDGKDLA
jgi:hypothetical protein